MDATDFLTHHTGMSEIKASSAAKCFATKLLVRRNQGEGRFEFETNRNRRCGNFASFEMLILGERVRGLPNGGHSALAVVAPKGLGPRLLKIYTYEGTEEDAELAGVGEDEQLTITLHGMNTFDFFNIVRTVTNSDGSFKDLPDWTEVRFPMALVVFGEKD